MTQELEQFQRICAELDQFAKRNRLETPELFLPADWQTFIRYHSNNVFERGMGVQKLNGIPLQYNIEPVKRALEFYADARLDGGTRAKEALSVLRRR